MVTDPLFPTCPIRNVLARICRPDTLWIIQLLGASRSKGYNTLLKNVPKSELANSLQVLIQDEIITEKAGKYALSTTGKELFPLVTSLITWCNEHLD